MGAGSLWARCFRSGEPRVRLTRSKWTCSTQGDHSLVSANLDFRDCPASNLHGERYLRRSELLFPIPNPGWTLWSDVVSPNSQRGGMVVLRWGKNRRCYPERQRPATLEGSLNRRPVGTYPGDFPNGVRNGQTPPEESTVLPRDAAPSISRKWWTRLATRPWLRRAWRRGRSRFRRGGWAAWRPKPGGPATRRAPS